MLTFVKSSNRILVCTVALLVFSAFLSGCRKEEQAVSHVAASAASAEHQAQAASAQFANEEWLDWGTGILMPQVATAVAQRKDDEAKAKLAADIVSARTQLRADFKAKRITVDELQKKLEELGRIEAKMVESTEVFEDNDDKSMGDPSDVTDTGKVAVDSDGEEADEAKGLVVPQGRGAKRKSDDDGNGFRDVEGQVRGV